MSDISITNKSSGGGFAGAKFSIKCPECRHHTERTIAELEKNPTITCRCGNKIKIEVTSLRKAGQQLKDIDRQIGNLFKRR